MDPQYVSLRWWFRGSHKPAGNFPRIIPLVTPTRADQRFTSAVFSSRRERALSLLYYVRSILFQLAPHFIYRVSRSNNGITVYGITKKKKKEGFIILCETKKEKSREIWNFNNISLIKLLVNDIDSFRFDASLWKILSWENIKTDKTLIQLSCWK